MKIVMIENSEKLKIFLNSDCLDEDIILQFNENTEYVLPGDRWVMKGSGKLIIEGNGAVLHGNGEGYGILIQKSNVEIHNLILEKYFLGIRVEAFSESISEISIQDCTFRNIQSEGVSTAIIKSGCSIENVLVNGNLFVAPISNENGHCSTAVNFMTACYTHCNMPIHHVSLKHIKCCNNQIIKNPDDNTPFMLGITVHGASAYGFYNNGDMINSPFNDAVDSQEEDIVIENNKIDGVWDIAIDVLAAFPGKKRCTLSKVSIRNNIIKYHNTAINIGTSNVPHNGHVEDCHTNMIYISENKLVPEIPGPNEPQIGIMLFAIRAESGVICCEHCSMSNVFVINNTILGREIGIALQAVHATQDLPYPSLLKDCVLENVVILENKIQSAQVGVRVYAAHLEGRKDPFWGFELEPFNAEFPFSTRCENAMINGVTIAHNRIEEYDMAFIFGAAWGCGYSFIKKCTIGNEIYIYDNELDPGRKVFCYEKQCINEVLYDNACGAGNYVMC